jgi:hypothetical protein
VVFKSAPGLTVPDGTRWFSFPFKAESPRGVTIVNSASTGARLPGRMLLNIVGCVGLGAGGRGRWERWFEMERDAVRIRARGITCPRLLAEQREDGAAGGRIGLYVAANGSPVYFSLPGASQGDV